MKVGSETVKFIEENADLINNNEFQELFDKAMEELGECGDLIRVIEAAKIDPGLEDHIPPDYAFMRRVIGRDVVFTGAEYDNEEDKEHYSKFEGDHGVITYVADLDFYVGYSDEINFFNSTWDIELDNGTTLEAINGYMLRPVPEL